MNPFNALINWFWSNPWNSSDDSRESTADLMRRLGLYRFLICIIAIFVVFIQGKHVLSLDLHGRHFFFYDRVTWYFDWLNIDQSYPLFDVINLYVAMAAFFLAAIGFKFRYTMTIAILSLFYIHGSRSALIGNNHHVLITWGHVLPILLFSRAGEAFSVSGPGKRPIERWEAIWPIRLTQLSLMIFYFSAGLAKFRVAGMGWLIDGSAIQRIILSRWQAQPLLHDLGVTIVSYPNLCWFFSVTLVLMELVFPLMLLMRWKSFNFFLVLSFAFFHLSTRFIVGLPFHFNSILLLVYIDHAPWIFSKSDQIKGAMKKRLRFS